MGMLRPTSEHPRLLYIDLPNALSFSLLSMGSSATKHHAIMPELCDRPAWTFHGPELPWLARSTAWKVLSLLWPCARNLRRLFVLGSS